MAPAHEHNDHAHKGHDGLLSRLLGEHKHGPHRLDTALAGSERGIWAVKVSLLALLLTSAIQLFVALMSGSVGLLADMIHNFSDALTAVPLWLAFQLSQRKPDRRYAYGYGRAEDLAGAIVVLMIFASSLVVFYESIQKLLNPEPMSNVVWVMAASLVGFLGNEAVAFFRIRVGRAIGSAALGFPLADPLVGLLIGVVVLFVTRDAAREMWHRLMDASDPEICQQVETIASQTAGVQRVYDVLVRWLGHQLRGELYIEVDADLKTSESHQIAEQVRHRVFDRFPAFAELTVHVEPCTPHGDNPHALTEHHQTGRVTGDG